MAAHPPPPQKLRVHKTAGKVFASTFFVNQGGILLSDYLPKGQTINAEYYSPLLVQLKDILKEKTPRKGHQGGFVLARQCSGSPAVATQKKLAYLGLHFLDHPPYSPNLAPSDYHPFPGMKKN